MFFFLSFLLFRIIKHDKPRVKRIEEESSTGYSYAQSKPTRHPVPSGKVTSKKGKELFIKNN